MGEKVIRNRALEEPVPTPGSEVHGFDQGGGVHILLVVASVQEPARWAMARCTLHGEPEAAWNWNPGAWSSKQLGRLIPAGAI